MRRSCWRGLRAGWVVLCLAGVLAGAAGCGRDAVSGIERPVAVGEPGGASATETATDQPALASTSIPMRGGSVDIDVLGLWREGEDVRLLTSLSTVGNDPVTVTSVLDGSFLGTVPAGGIRLVDVAGRRVFVPVTASEAPVVVAPGRPALVVSVFVVPAELASVTVLFNQGDLLGPLTIAASAPSWSIHGRLPTIKAPGSGRVAGGARSLTDVSETAAGLLEVRTKERREVSLPSDVLFAKGDATLSARSGEALEAAARTLTTLPPGTVVTIVGHTDDDGTDAYNFDLSRRRAESVRGALRERLEARQVVLRSDGKGEREPLAPNRTASGAAIEENQALNRRVVLAVPEGVEASVASLTAVDGTLTAPDATPATGGVAVAGSIASASAGRSDAGGAGTYRLDVTGVGRVPGALTVTLALQALGGEEPDDRWAQLFGAGPRSDGRIDVDELSPEAMSLRGLRVVASGVFRRPLVDDAAWVLGSRNLGAPLPAGGVVSLTVCFADVSPDATTIDLQVPTFGVFRGLPVT